jgi:hypothetical protein
MAAINIAKKELRQRIKLVLSKLTDDALATQCTAISSNMALLQQLMGV